MFTNIFSFGYTNGAYLYAGLIQLEDGALYGACQNGGLYGNGTVFRLTTNGVLSTLIDFAGNDGAYPKGTLTQGPDRALYGTTHGGGAGGFGTVFRITTNGHHSVLASFSETNGAWPSAGLVLARDGALYGTTSSGGTNTPPKGTVFRVTTNGTFTSLFSFNGHNGSGPWYGLSEGHDGRLYGTAESAGPRGHGVAFAITTNGFYSILAAFADEFGVGVYPSSGLTPAADGSLYGTTRFDHVYRLSTNGHLFAVAAFYNYFAGQNPVGGVIIGPDHGLYGVTQQGGLQGGGIVYRVDLASVLFPLARTGAQWNVMFHGLADATYQIHRADDAASGWEKVAEVMTDYTGVARWTDPSGPTARRFYRVVGP